MWQIYLSLTRAIQCQKICKNGSKTLKKGSILKNSILQRCHKLKMIECSRKLLLPHVYLHPIHVVPNPTFNGKLEVNVRKIAAALGLASCVVSEIAQ